MPENYVLLERTELNASAASVTFANIPQSGYTDLKIVASVRNNGAQYYGRVYFNANTTGYSRRGLYGDGTSAGSLSIANEYTFVSNPSTYTANTFSNFEMYVPNYNGSANKSFSIDATTENNATLSYAWMYAGLWSNTASITSITLEPNPGDLFVQYSTFSLYGIAALGTTPAIAPKASGGNIIATDGTYWYHAFTSSGTFTPQVGLSCDVLVVAGGGGSGANVGAGGGAGGLRLLALQSFANATAYTVSIGGGGTGGVGGSGAGGAVATAGVNSSIIGGALSIATSGGGSGGSGYTGKVNGGNGGSGGGSTYSQTFSTGNTGGYSPVEGYRGGIVDASLYGRASGGGGASQEGFSASAGGAGAGGAGVNSYNSIDFSTWLSATSTGSSGRLAGGGGGGNYNGPAAGLGGVGGGGNGSLTNVVGNAGVANTGGGGGGGGGDFVNGAAGGSGIIIVRYPI